MTTGQRTIAATFFEKGLDEERVEATTVNVQQLIEKYCQEEKLYLKFKIFIQTKQRKEN